MTIQKYFEYTENLPYWWDLVVFWYRLKFQKKYLGQSYELILFKFFIYTYLRLNLKQMPTNIHPISLSLSKGGLGMQHPIYKLVSIMVLAQLHVYLNFGHILNAPAILFNQITSIHNDNFEVINSCCIMIWTYSAR